MLSILMLAFSTNAMAGDCKIRNKTKYQFKIDYSGAGSTGSTFISSNSCCTQVRMNSKVVFKPPFNDHNKTFAGVCSTPNATIVEENGVIYLKPE